MATLFSSATAKAQTTAYKPTMIDSVITDISGQIDLYSRSGYSSITVGPWDKVDKVDTEANPNRKLLDADVLSIRDQLRAAGYKAEFDTFQNKEVKFRISW